MDTLTQALINAQKPRENAWSTAGQGMSQDTMSYLTNDKQFGDDDPTSRLVASLISGLGGAALQGFGAYQERERRNTLNQDLMSLGGAYYGGKDINPLVGSLQSSEARDLVPLLQIEQASNQRDLRQEVAKEIAKRETDFLYDQKDKGLIVQGNKWDVNPSYLDSTSKIQGAKVLAEEQAKLEAQKGAGAPPKEIAEREDKFRTELFQRSGVDGLRTVDQMFNSMIKSYPDESGASDIDFIYGGAKAVDPESVVRGSEGVMFQKTGGILGELAALLGQVKSGRKLRPEERKSILDLVGRRRDELVNTYTGAVNEYKGLTDRAGGNFANVGIYGDYQPSSGLLEALNKPAQNTANAPVQGPDGNMYIINRGPDGKPISKTKVN